MPGLIEHADARHASLAECVDALSASGFDPADEASLVHAAVWLRRLGNDSDFLGDILVAELADRHRDTSEAGGYGPQVIMLAPPRGQFFIRANLWPSTDEPMLRASGGASFVYGLPHDHNFDFLTLGYFGPGYWSDYYEYDYAAVTGARGEPVPSLRFVERSRLKRGRMLHYRVHRDVHAQFPADSLSVSLNVMHVGAAQGWSDQYSFDLEQRRVGKMLTNRSSEALLRIAVALGSDEAVDLAHTFARRHPSDAMRLCALDALAAGCSDAGERDALWCMAEGAGSLLVALEATARRVALAA